MFAFISKLLPRRSTAQLAHKSATVNDALIAKQIAVQQSRQKDEEQLRHAYLQKIAAAANNETTSIELLLACDFADGRFQAAQAVHTAAGLEKLKLAMRNTDKRVAKLMQTRLDEIHRTEQGLAAAENWFAQVEGLLAQEVVLSNQVSDLEKLGTQIVAFPSSQQSLFDEKRLELAQRLALQASLQRELLDLVQAIDAVEDQSDVQLSTKIDEWEAISATVLAHPHAAAIPKNLTREASQKLSALRHNWQSAQQRAQVSASNVRDESSAGPVPSLGCAQDSGNEIHGQDGVDQAELQSSPVEKPHTSKPSLSLVEIELALSGLEKALEQGSIQSARKFDRELRDVDMRSGSGGGGSGDSVVLSATTKDRLGVARKELGNMLSWAKWSGNVSRDELVATAEGLATLSLSPKELVGTVSALRDQWKQMEASGSSANKTLWERFDTACSAAYAPAAQHFQEQAALRKVNLQEAQSLLSGFQISAQGLLTSEPDWKAINQALVTMRQEWKNLGQLDRKDKQRLDETLAQTLNSLREPLAEQQALEVAARNKLIAEAQEIDAAQKTAVDQLRSLQEQWKSRAGKIPLPRKDEQELWERFRAACDAVFDQRKQALATADLGRQESLLAKQQLCARLETCSLNSKGELLKELQQCSLLHRALGPVPRDQEAAIEQRYQAAVAALQLVIDGYVAQESRAGLVRLLESLAICQSAESVLSVVSGDQESDALLQRWKANQATGKFKLSVIELKLQARFDCAMQAMAAQADPETRQVQQETAQRSLPQFDDLLLHLEILTGAESPESLSRERLKKQVEVLQGSLKNGKDRSTTQVVLAQLLGLSVVLDSTRQKRLETVIALAI